MMDFESEDDDTKAEIEASLYSQIYHSSQLELPATSAHEYLTQTTNELESAPHRTQDLVVERIKQKHKPEVTEEKIKVPRNLSNQQVSDGQIVDVEKSQKILKPTNINSKNKQNTVDIKSRKKVKLEKIVISETDSDDDSDVQVVSEGKSPLKTPTLPNKRPVVHSISSSESDTKKKRPLVNKHKQQKFQTKSSSEESSSDSHQSDQSDSRKDQSRTNLSDRTAFQTASTSKTITKAEICLDSDQSDADKERKSKRQISRTGSSSDDSSDEDNDRLPFWAHLDNIEHEGDSSITMNTVTNSWQNIYDIAMSVSQSNSDYKQNTSRDRGAAVKNQSDNHLWGRIKSLEDVLCDMSDMGWSVNLDDKYSKKSTTKRYCNLKCNNCNEKGHLATNCPEPTKKRPCMFCSKIHSRISRGYHGAMRDMCCPDIICTYCGDSHISTSCMRKKSVINLRCRRCQQYGHMEKNCHELWRQWYKTTDTRSCQYPLKCANNALRAVRKYCSVCAGRDHFSFECGSVHFSQLPPLNPLIRHYNVRGNLASFPFKYSQTPNHDNTYNTHHSNNYDTPSYRHDRGNVYTTPKHLNNYDRNFTHSAPSHHLQSYSKRKNFTNSQYSNSEEPPPKRCKHGAQSPTPHRYNFSDDNDYRLALQVKNSNKKKSLKRLKNKTRGGKSKATPSRDQFKTPFKGGSSKITHKGGKSNITPRRNNFSATYKGHNSKITPKIESSKTPANKGGKLENANSSKSKNDKKNTKKDNFKTKTKGNNSNTTPKLTPPVNGKISFTDKNGRYKPKAFDQAAALAAAYQQQKNKGTKDTRRKVSKRKRFSAPL